MHNPSQHRQIQTEIFYHSSSCSQGSSAKTTSVISRPGSGKVKATRLGEPGEHHMRVQKIIECTSEAIATRYLSMSESQHTTGSNKVKAMFPSPSLHTIRLPASCRKRRCTALILPSQTRRGSRRPELHRKNLKTETRMYRCIFVRAVWGLLQNRLFKLCCIRKSFCQQLTTGTDHNATRN